MPPNAGAGSATCVEPALQDGDRRDLVHDGPLPPPLPAALAHLAGGDDRREPLVGELDRHREPAGERRPELPRRFGGRPLAAGQGSRQGVKM